MFVELFRCHKMYLKKNTEKTDNASISFIIVCAQWTLPLQWLISFTCFLYAFWTSIFYNFINHTFVVCRTCNCMLLTKWKHVYCIYNISRLNSLGVWNVKYTSWSDYDDVHETLLADVIIFLIDKMLRLENFT